MRAARPKGRLKETIAIVEACRPLLAGHSQEVQGAVLAELVATFLSSHIVWNLKEHCINRRGTDALRDMARELFSGTVDELVPIEEAWIMESPDIKKPWESKP